MSQKMFSDGDLIKFGWSKTKQHFGLFLAVTVVACLGIFIPVALVSLLPEVVDISYSLVNLIVFIVFIGMSGIIGAGYMQFFLNAVDEKPISLGDLFGQYKVALNYIVVVVLYGLIIIGGVFLLIFPGIRWSLKYMFAPMLVIDRGLKPLAALKESGRMTDGVKWDLYGFQQIMGTTITIGYLALLAGLLVAIPVNMIATMALYRHLSSR